MRERPFQPFCFRLADGVIHVILHAEQAMVTERSVIIGVPRFENSPRDDFRDYIRLSLVDVIEIDSGN